MRMRKKKHLDERLAACSAVNLGWLQDYASEQRGVNPPDPSHVHTYGDWSSDSTEHWHECTDENCPDRLGSITDRTTHVYDNEKDNVCDECGYVRSFIPSVPVFLPAHHVHTYGDWSKNSTEHWHECTNMNCPNRADSIKDRAEHDFGEWVVTLQPTTESEGREERVCAVCAYKEKRSIPVVEPEKIDEPELFTLSFEMNGGSGIPDISLTRGESVDLSEYEPTRRGYDFDGWYSDKKLTKKITSVKLNRDRTVYAGWTEQVSDVSGEIDIDLGGHFSDESENPNTGCGLSSIRNGIRPRQAGSCPAGTSPRFRQADNAYRPVSHRKQV